ncbi:MULTISPECIES: hypothetical protein [Helcococcus]|uniref:Phage protein n=1 Tax=Helcococcus bovis TaxID=3153252 RepID=A0ABW9FA19_9FIRM
MENKTSESQLKASTKWNKKNKDKMNHIRNRSGAKKYISNATNEELKELEKLIKERRKLLY